MPFIPAATVASVQLEGTVDGCQTINDLYFNLPGGFIPADLESLATNFVDFFTLSFSDNLSSDWSTVAVHVRGLNVPQGFVVDRQAGPTPGGVDGEAAPNNVAACLSFRTGLAGRSNRGRNYIPALPNAEITLNTMSPTLMEAIRTTYALLLPGGGGLPGGWEWGVLSRYSGVDVNGKPIPRENGVFTPITSTLFTDNKVDSMRSRKPGHGK